MSFWTKLFNRTRPADPSRGTSIFSQRMVPPNIRLSTEDQMSLSAVFACVRVIAEALASSPWDVYQDGTDGERELLPNDPVAWLLNNRPNPDMPPQSFKEALVINALVHGNGYAEIIRDLADRVVELRVLPSDRMEPHRDEQGNLYYVFSQQNGDRVRLEPRDVYHLRALASVDGLMGDSVIGRAAKTLASVFAAEQFGLAYFANNAQVGTIIKVPRPLKPQEEADMLASWESSKGGARKAFKPMVAPPGVEVIQSDVKAADAQVLQTRQFSVEEVIRFFGVPPHLVGVAVASQGYGRNLAELGLTFVRHTLRAWAKRMEQEANYKLFPQRKPWKFTELDLTWLTEGDALANAQANEILFRNGVISKNEWRDSLNRNDIEGGDEYDGKAAETAAESDEQPSEDTQGMAEGNQAPMHPMPSESDVGARAINALVKDKLERHAKRLQAREADLRRSNQNGVLAGKLEAARTELRARATEELQVLNEILSPRVDTKKIYESAVLAAESGDINEISQALVIQLTAETQS